ncbi:hypothetical protein [Rhodohalobacter sp.]|uniref:hypothetical protein n=1 Tax=Rhodohalobacter sp. TaxID=1974210 RepID=UPI002ACDBFEA|nr:hypothetical protein [Rhodohalobacter sp.]MDZ7756807.1 hypothetical protein [Rhodohalobacter sp.]
MKLIQLFAWSILLVIAFGFATVEAQDSSEDDPKLEVWGYVFGDMFWKADGDEDLWGRGEFMSTEKNAIGGNLRRIYVGFDHDISSNLTTRVLFETNSGTIDPSGKFSPIVKLGYIRWDVPVDFLHNNVVSVGLIPTPIFSFPEKSFGYRSVEKEALDARGIGRSADQGISYSATFDEDSNFGFTALLGNGTGNRPTETKRLEYTGSVFAKFLDSRLTVETMYNYKSLGNDRENSILRGFVGFETDQFRFGGEVARILNSVGTAQGFNDVEPILYSVFYAFKIPSFSDDVEFFGRYDRYNPDTDYETGKVYPNDPQFFSNQSLAILGLKYQPIDRVNIMPNLYFNIYDEKRDEIEDRKTDIVLRTTIYYSF